MPYTVSIRAYPFASLIGGTVLGSGALTKIIGIGAKTANTVMNVMDFGANTAITLGTGNLKNGGSLGAKDLTAIGFSSVAGGLIGGAAALSGVGDFIKSGKILNNDPQNLQESSAYVASGLAKIGGAAVGAFGGAKLGAAIGVVGGPAGALIGAGLGGIVGILAGDAIVRHMKAAKFETEEMKNAIKDTNVSAEELARTFDKVVYSKRTVFSKNSF